MKHGYEFKVLEKSLKFSQYVAIYRGGYTDTGSVEEYQLSSEM